MLGYMADPILVIRFGPAVLLIHGDDVAAYHKPPTPSLLYPYCAYTKRAIAGFNWGIRAGRRATSH